MTVERAAAIAIRQAITISPSLMPDDLPWALAVRVVAFAVRWCEDGSDAVVGLLWPTGVAEAAAPDGLGPGVCLAAAAEECDFLLDEWCDFDFDLVLCWEAAAELVTEGWGCGVDFPEW